ncbi:MAG: hypothetical protein RQ842_09675 [Vulcanisaeta sp.]|nr:hypothetical protein [Vulcanisaeta sp.]
MSTANGIPKDIDHMLRCSWHDPVSGMWACIAVDGYYWDPLDIYLIKKKPDVKFKYIINSRNVDTLLGLILPHNTFCTKDIIDLMKSHGKHISWCKPVDYNDIPSRGAFIIAFDDDLNAYV